MTAPIRSAVAFATVLLLAACSQDQSNASTNSPNLFTVARGDLPITVKENAELQALRETIVRSEVEGQTTVISIVPEGTMVAQGDLLIALDVSELEEKKANQAIAVTKADSAQQQAKSSRDILEKELTTKLRTAESNLTIAQLELEKFLGRAHGQRGAKGTNAEMVRKLTELVSTAPPAPTVAADGAGAPTEDLVAKVDPRNFARLVDKVQELLHVVPAGGATDEPARIASAVDHDMGSMANQILQQVDQIRLAMADLKVKEDTWRHSEKLAIKEFITRNELERDQLAYQSQMSKVTLAWNDLDLLVNYTLAQTQIKLRQDVDNAGLELARVIDSNAAAVRNADSDLLGKEAEYNLAKERLDNLERQIKNGIIKAPTPGVVVYAKIDRGRGGEAVREGVQVRERQDLIILPDTTKMRCVIKVQEAQVDKIARGQPAYVQAEAFPGEVFTGRVTSVAPVADSNSGWMTSDRKVYTTNVELDGDNPDGRLRSRMAAAVTIQIDTVKDVLPVPAQAVRRDRSVHYVWKQTAKGPVATVVEIGQHNTERVAITSGLAVDDVIHIAPPAGVQEPKFEQPELPTPAPVTNPAPATTPEAIGTPGPARADSAPADGARGNGGPGRRGGPQKKIADMTPEERTEYTTRLDGMLAMADRSGATPEQTQQFVDAIDKIKKAIAANQIEAAQTQADALRGLMRTLMGSRGGGGGRRNGGGGEGAPGDTPRDRGN